VPAPDNLALCRRGEPEYDEARDNATWNKRLAAARAPAAIVRCRSTEEVARALEDARRQGLKVSPRGSGHHYEAAALRDGGLLLDLGLLCDVEIEREARTARVGAGVTGGALLGRLAEQRLAFPVGHCADVALSGYLLAGGFGWNAGAWGPASASVTAVELVTAAGERLLASEDEYPDLLWAAKGHGPGFFAAITAYHLALHPLPSTAFAWSTSFAAESAPALADWLTAATAAAEASAEIIALVGAEPKSGRPAVTVRAIAVGESEDQARSRIASFHSPPKEAEPIGDTSEEAMPFIDLHRLSAMPHNKRVAADHLWSDASLGELLLAAAPGAEAPSKFSTINLVSFGGNGAVAAPPRGQHGALSVGGTAGAGIYAMWDHPADDDANREWVRRVDEALAPLRSGRYVGEADLTAGPDRRAECFTPEALGRLTELRERYDPDGLFFAYP
jgi:FAD/FMN-containing dehydrogenase